MLSVDDAVQAVLWNRAARPKVVALGCSWIAHHSQFAGNFGLAQPTKPELYGMLLTVTPVAGSITLIGAHARFGYLKYTGQA